MLSVSRPSACYAMLLLQGHNMTGVTPVLACSSGACHLLRDSGTDMAHIVQGVWSTVSAFVIDTRSLHSISDSVSAIRAMSAVSKEHGIMVQDTCEAAYKQHEV